MTAEFPSGLPRLEALWRRHPGASGRNFFRLFPQRLAGDRVTFRYYADFEHCLSCVPQDQWEAFAAKIDETAEQFDTKQHRHWEKLHDVLNEARGARLLVRHYKCSTVQMLEPSQTAKTPDWKGITPEGQLHYAEVKTLNHSNEDQAMWAGGPVQPLTACVGEGLLNKLRSSYGSACEQLAAAPGAGKAVKAVILAVHVDCSVWSLEYSAPELIDRAVRGLEVVGFPLHTECLDVREAASPRLRQ